MEMNGLAQIRHVFFVQFTRYSLFGAVIYFNLNTEDGDGGRVAVISYSRTY